jgi:DNA repair photolyase
MEKSVIIKSILNKHKKRDPWFLDDYSVNPYEGCSFNCLYCYIRGSKYGENMEEGLSLKSNALELSNRAKKGQRGFVVMASATDAYMPLENKFKMSRSFLELFLKHRFPVHVITKSTLVTRDLDLLQDIDNNAILPPDLADLKRGVIISFSLSTLDKHVADKLEPGAPSPLERLETMKKCKAAGFLTGVNALPLLPFISDSPEQIGELIRVAKAHGADYVLAGGLTIFGTDKNSSKELYYKFLERHYPQLIPNYNKFYQSYYFPPKAYQARLKLVVDSLCDSYKIKNRIL